METPAHPVTDVQISKIYERYGKRFPSAERSVLHLELKSCTNRHFKSTFSLMS